MGSFRISYKQCVFLLMVAFFVECCCSEDKQVVQRNAPNYPQMSYDYPVGTQNFQGYSWDTQLPYTIHDQASGSFAKQATQVVAKDCDPVPKETSALSSKTINTASSVLLNEQPMPSPKQTYDQLGVAYNPNSFSLSSNYDQSMSTRSSNWPYVLLYDANTYPFNYQSRSAPVQQILQPASFQYSNVALDSLAGRMSQPISSYGSSSMGFGEPAPKYMERAYAINGIQPSVVMRRPPYSYSSLYPTRGLPIQHIQPMPVLKSVEPTGNSILLRSMYKVPKYNFEGAQYDYEQNRASGVVPCRDKRQMESASFGMPDYTGDSPSSYGGQGLYDQWRSSSQMSQAGPMYESQYNSPWMNNFQPQQRGNFHYPQSRAVEGITQLVSGLTHLWPMISSYSGNF